MTLIAFARFYCIKVYGARGNVIGVCAGRNSWPSVRRCSLNTCTTLQHLLLLLLLLLLFTANELSLDGSSPFSVAVVYQISPKSVSVERTDRNAVSEVKNAFRCAGLTKHVVERQPRVYNLRAEFN